MQQIVSGAGVREKIPELLKTIGVHRCLVVCNYLTEDIKQILYSEGLIDFQFFTDFSSNPKYEDVCRGLQCFFGCDSILAIGGGSAIDIAKCIKLFCKLDNSANYLEQKYSDSGVSLFAVPTTAGTGSESTHFAVLYYDGKKYSVTHESILPNVAILDAELLNTLPLYQKKCTLLDALCQAIESWWSINSTDESIELSKHAIKTIVTNIDSYLSRANDMKIAQEILEAANLAGQAINITRTTAVHAMSYKITSLYNLPHGHAVAICMPTTWKYMYEHLERCCDSRGKEYVESVFQAISSCIGCKNTIDAIEWFRQLLYRLEILSPVATEEEITILASSVNAERLKNNPIRIDNDVFLKLYRDILRGDMR